MVGGLYGPYPGWGVQLGWAMDFLLQLGLSWSPHASLAAKPVLKRATQDTLRVSFLSCAISLPIKVAAAICVKKGRAQPCVHMNRKKGQSWEVEDSEFTIQH